MIHSRFARMALATAFAIGLAACQDTPRLVSPDPVGTPLFQVQQPPGGAAPDRAAVARAVPGFGGVFLDESGVPTVYLTDLARRGAVQSALASFARDQGFAPSDIRVLQGRFDYLELDGWFHRLWIPAFEGGGIVMAGIDERRNAVLIGIHDPSAEARLRAVAVQLGVAPDALIIEEMEPVRPMETLRDRASSIRGGYQIHFGNYLCTLGFLALRGNEESFITNSHCTNTQGGTEGTLYYQPTSSVDPTVIGVEVDDPEYWRHGICPRGSRCRYSDAARARRESDRAFSRGFVARTSGPNNGSLTVTGAFEITGTFDGDVTNPAAGTQCPVVGTTLNKVGRTTGWTQGVVSNTCFHVGVLGSNIVQLYQVRVDAGVAGGDSGSPVFGAIDGSNATLYGILWGGSSSSFVYSPLTNVEHELGSLTVTAGGESPGPTTGTITGTVTDAGSGAPIAGATVAVNDTEHSTTTNAEGHYTLSGLGAASYDVTASADGYQSLTKAAGVTAGGTTTVDFALSPDDEEDDEGENGEGEDGGIVTVGSITYTTHGGRNNDRHLTVTVSIVDGQGAPLSGATVSITLSHESGSSWSATATTNGSGTVSFGLNNAPAGCYETVVTDVSAAGFDWDGGTPEDNSFCK